MGSILHGNAKTTPRIRKEIQESLESAPKLAESLNLNVKTVLKWKKSTIVEDKRSGPLRPKSVLSSTQQQVKLNSGVFLNCLWMMFTLL